MILKGTRCGKMDIPSKKKITIKSEKVSSSSVKLGVRLLMGGVP